MINVQHFKDTFNALDYRGVFRNAHGREWKRRVPSDIRGIVLHQTGGGDSINALGKYHSGPNHISQEGLPGIAYTIFVNKDGDVFLCNDFEDVTWSHGDRTQAGDENKLLMSICFGGRFKPWPGSVVDPTTTQMDIARELWMYFSARMALGPLGLFGHYHFGKDACPGQALESYIESVRSAGPKIDTDADWQEALQQAGFAPGAIDGQWGPKSQAAAEAYLKARNLAGVQVRGLVMKAELSRP